MKVYGILEVAQFEHLSADPALAPNGRVYWNTTTDRPKFRRGTALTWNTVVDAESAQTLALKTFTGVAGVTLASGASIDWAAGNASVGASIGSNTFTIGGAGTTIRVPGTLYSQVGLVTDDSDLVLNNDGSGVGGDWKATLRRPAAGMTGTAVYTLPTATGTLAALGLAQTWTAVQTLQSPVFVTPTLGTPASGNLANCTGLPVGGITGVLPPANGGTGVANNAASTWTVSGNFAMTATLTGITGVTFPTTGTLSTLAGAEVITNKDHDGGTASNTSRFTVPKAALATLTALTRKQATLLYDTGANALLIDDGTNLNTVGGGAGEKNYLNSGGGAAGASNSNGSSSASGWAASGSITVATHTTAANLPRPNTTKTGLLITGASSTSEYVYYRFVLDDADAGKKLKLQFDMKPGTAVASDFEVRVYSNTASDYVTGNTRLALSTDNSTPASLLPALTGTYRTTFDAPAVSAKYIEVRVKSAAAHTHTLYLSDVVVGPGLVQQGAAVSEWVSYTPTGTWVANTTYSGRYRRVGDSMEIQARVVLSGAPTSAGLTFSIPTGYTIDSSKIVSGATSLQQLGTVDVYDDVGGSGLARLVGHVMYNSSTTVFLSAMLPGSGSANYLSQITDTVPITFAVNDQVNVNFRIPIAEWAGSGTVNVVQNDVEYVYNSAGTTGAGSSDTTTFAYGPAGAAIGSIASTTVAGGSQTSMRVRFQTPVAASDRVVLEIDADGSGKWYTAAERGFVSINQGGARYGARVIPVTSSTTDFDVQFGNAGLTPDGATNALASSLTWASLTSARWRVRKERGGAAIGFSEVNPGVSSGLVSANGLKGTATNTTAPAGYVGEYKEATVSTTAFGASNTFTDCATLTGLTAGAWDISARLTFTGGTTVTGCDVFIGTAAGNNTTNRDTLRNYAAVAIQSGSDATGVIANYRVTIAAGATPTYYLKGRAIYAAAPSYYGSITATRVY